MSGVVVLGGCRLVDFMSRFCFHEAMLEATGVVVRGGWVHEVWWGVKATGDVLGLCLVGDGKGGNDGLTFLRWVRGWVVMDAVQETGECSSGVCVGVCV